MLLKELTLIAVLINGFNMILLGTILCISWNYGVTALSPLIPKISWTEAILIKIAFSSFIGDGFKFSIN